MLISEPGAFGHGREVHHTFKSRRSNWQSGRSDIPLQVREKVMLFKASIIAFTAFICAAMLTIAHYDAHFAQLPKSVLAKRAA